MDPNSGRIYDPKEIEDLPQEIRERLVHGSREELEKLQAHIYAEGIQGFTPVIPPIVDEAQDLVISKTFWNGLPITATRGTAIVADAPEFPEYWARDLVGERIPVIEANLEGANHGGGISYLDNSDGSGWRKVTSGGGPDTPHRDVSVVPGSFEKFDEEEAEALGEMLEAMADVMTMPDAQERFYPINRAARRASEKRERKQKFVNKPKQKEARDRG